MDVQAQGSRLNRTVFFLSAAIIIFFSIYTILVFIRCCLMTVLLRF